MLHLTYAAYPNANIRETVYLHPYIVFNFPFSFYYSFFLVASVMICNKMGKKSEPKAISLDLSILIKENNEWEGQLLISPVKTYT